VRILTFVIFLNPIKHIYIYLTLFIIRYTVYGWGLLRSDQKNENKPQATHRLQHYSTTPLSSLRVAPMNIWSRPNKCLKREKVVGVRRAGLQRGTDGHARSAAGQKIRRALRRPCPCPLLDLDPVHDPLDIEQERVVVPEQHRTIRVRALELARLLRKAFRDDRVRQQAERRVVAKVPEHLP